MVGAASTVRLAVLLPVPVVVCVVVTPDVAFGCMPGMLLVTGKVTVQLPLAGMVIPEKLREVWPTVKVVPAAHDPPTTPPTADMLVSESLNAAPVRAEALLFDSVKVTVGFPPD